MFVVSRGIIAVTKKEPVGIVYHVNRDPDIDNLGYAVYIHEVAPEAFADSLGIEQKTSASLMKEDGNENTYAMYYSKEVKSPLARKVFDMWRYGQSTYIPLVKQVSGASICERTDPGGGWNSHLSASGWLLAVVFYGSGGAEGKQGLALFHAVGNDSGNSQGSVTPIQTCDYTL